MNDTKTIEYVLRIGFEHFNSPAKLRDMIGFCRKAGIREVQLVPVDLRRDVSVFPPRKDIPARCRELKPIIAGLRQAGIKPGYCVLRTFMATSVTGKDYIGFKQGRTDMSGKVAMIHPCPLDGVYLDYIKNYYAALAGTGPATMLTDDDFRYEYIAGMGPTCFCPLHLKEFRRRFGHKVQREQLAAILEKPDAHLIKNDWMEFKRILLVELARELRETVHKVNPGIRMGLMLTCTEISALEGRDIRELVMAFAGDLPPVVRPGQGCYADTDRLMIIKGLTETAYQCSQMPSGTEMQAEVDFYPHSTFNKSVDFGLDFQIQANLACGLKKINLWPFGATHDVTADHPFAGIMARRNKVFNRILNTMPEGARMRGAQVIYSPHAAQLRRQRAQDVQMYIGPTSQTLWRLGIPWTFEASPVAVLTHDSFPMTHEQARSILSHQNVFMDSDAARLIAGMGLMPAPGLKIVGQLAPPDCITELILSDNRNGAANGGIPTHSAGQIVKFKIAASSQWQPLSRFVNLAGKPGAPGMLAVEHNGRRLAVCAGRLGAGGFWANETRQAQLHGVFAWLYGGVPPAAVHAAPDVCPVLMAGAAEDAVMLGLINVSTARADGITVNLATRGVRKKYELCYITDDGRLVAFAASDLIRRRGVIEIRLRGAAAIAPSQVRFIVRLPVKTAKMGRG